jgi:hypothetical protein
LSDPTREFTDLLGALCDQRLSETDRARLETLALADRDLLRLYLRFIQLHGLLHWDAAGGAIDVASLLEPASERAAPARRTRRTLTRWAFSAAALVCLLLAGWAGVPWKGLVSGRIAGPVAGPAPAGDAQPDGDAQPPAAIGPTAPAVAAAPGRRVPGTAPVDSAVRLSHPRDGAPVVSAAPQRSTGNPSAPTVPPSAGELPPPGDRRSSESMVAVIDQALAESWREHEVQPAPRADDAAWLRRVHLDLVGRIPEADVVETFLADARPDKRARIVDDLLANPEFSRHYSVVWTNLLIGHTAPREVNRPALEKFLREQFHRNRPWSETVERLVAAEGYEDENGAANFLLAHLNNEAVPATAVTARVLLCEQLQCTQCHDHPFVDWTQDRFWQLNAFFQQTEIVRHSRHDPQTGRRLRDRLELVSLESGGPTYFEDRQSRMQVVYPQFDGVDVEPAADVDRRRELARLLSAGESPQLARAFVNRMWGKFFGYAFTNPVDDMGPHNRPVLPELLDSLAAGFVRSGYDVKQLARWICLSQPYQLSHTGGSSVDAPEDGSPPLFSRAYVRPLSAEQLFDSLLTATQADRAGARYWDEVEARRRDWLEQFYTALDNDENAEEDTFQGSLAQTLVLMNGDLIRQATSAAPGSVLHQVLSRDVSDEERIGLLSLATLSRRPSASELATLRRVLRQHVQARPREVTPQEAQQEGYRDLMWAYLNSSEFRSNF